MKKFIDMALIFITSIFIVFSSTYYLFGFSSLDFIFFIGKFFIILITSTFLSFILSSILINLYFFTYLKVLKSIVNHIFILPEHIYAVVLLTLVRQNTKTVIIIFSIINTLILLKKYIEKIEELNKKYFINHLKLLDMNHFKLFFNHILPILNNVLVSSIITRIIFIFDIYILLYIVDILNIFKNSDISIFYTFYFFAVYVLIKYITTMYKGVTSTYI